MKLLIGYASRYRATEGIAREIGRILVDSGHDVDVLPLEQARPGEYDAYIIGSAVYMGNWLKAAREFVDRHAAELRACPTWLFSSGPIGDPAKPEGDPQGLPPILEKVAPREHRLFAGRLDWARLNLAEKAIVTMLKAPQGDYRNLADVRVWAAEIGEALRIGGPVKS